MALSVGIVGLPNVGKSTLLNALTHAGAPASNYPFCTIEQNVGVAAVPDPDLARLAQVLSPVETVPASVRFVDVAGLVQGASRGEGLGNKFLGHIREVDAILHVVRCFENPEVTHVTAQRDPLRDLEIVETEFMLADLETAERGLERWTKALHHGKGAGGEEASAFREAAAALGAGRRIADLSLPEKEQAILTEARFLTAKPCLYLANTDEHDPGGRGPLVASLREARGAERVLPLSVRIEEEIEELPAGERAEFLAGLGLECTALDLVIGACFRLLGLITYYTIANEKLRAWSLPSGADIVRAAEQVHTDMARGFIRAEVMALEDLVAQGSRQALHAHGLLHTVGRDYVVKDKDVLHVLFRS